MDKKPQRAVLKPKARLREVAPEAVDPDDLSDLPIRSSLDDKTVEEEVDEATGEDTDPDGAAIELPDREAPRSRLRTDED